MTYNFDSEIEKAEQALDNDAPVVVTYRQRRRVPVSRGRRDGDRLDDLRPRAWPEGPH